MIKVIALALGAVLVTAPAVYADPGNGNGEGGHTYKLSNGMEFSTPGKMFQHLRDRDDGAAGNPKAIVDAYPNSFDNVGDLIHQKRIDD